MTPREEFVLKHDRYRAYEHAFLDIGFGVTISGPHLVGRMTSAIDVARGEKVLEIGTGSGYQSAYLANLTDKVWSIEIVRPLAERTRGVYDALIAAGYTEYNTITTKQADGYYGWEEVAPFEQLKPGGIMVIPVGPPRRTTRIESEKRRCRRRYDPPYPVGHLRRQDRAVRPADEDRGRPDCRHA
jgi:protein-L-isoaspartate(D-aspartate) O-methyltransferase